MKLWGLLSLVTSVGGLALRFLVLTVPNPRSNIRIQKLSTPGTIFFEATADERKATVLSDIIRKKFRPELEMGMESG